MKLKLQSLATLATAAFVLACANSARAAVIELGSTFTPTGADYSITALQGITASNPLGTGGLGTQVNQNVEYAGAYGVTYVSSTGSLATNFPNSGGGLNIYNNGLTSGIQSTGLKIGYNSAVDAATINVTLEDFDNNSATSYGPAQKATPQITLLDSTGGVIGTATPAQILASNPTFIKTNDGTFNINLGNVLTAMGQSDQSISGYILSAPDSTGTLQGPNTNDPYFLVSTTNGGTPTVPETSSLLPLLGVLGMVMVGSRVRRKKEEAVAAC